ncbi:hypothetical protein CPB84DRAFT_1846069 [Gymnopilus junonius]|uniref:Uncharacterized protein n=1 Tax=Gymnopilus junonius TaxID=109634 RepID=A0A9P5NQK4_GYMJU|nr:hypothetical protein CPB84DRAFT_1846069 [Gymnopilus junonius]
MSLASSLFFWLPGFLNIQASVVNLLITFCPGGASAAPAHSSSPVKDSVPKTSTALQVNAHTSKAAPIPPATPEAVEPKPPPRLLLRLPPPSNSAQAFSSVNNATHLLLNQPNQLSRVACFTSTGAVLAGIFERPEQPIQFILTRIS